MLYTFRHIGELGYHDPSAVGVLEYQGVRWSREDTPHIANWIERAFGVRPLACYRSGGYRELEHTDLDTQHTMQNLVFDGEVLLLMPNKSVVILGEPFTHGHGLDLQLYPLFTPS